MGLCKCPHRKVTNIFCYEHRVNVCEHCLIANHEKCVVDTYKNWITDSLYTTKCQLCQHELVDGETVRLLCFHIVHWKCLNKYCKSLPATLAPPGYKCPVCNKMCLFPAINQISPIGDKLKEKLIKVNWGRTGLGLEQGLELEEEDDGAGQQQSHQQYGMEPPQTLTTPTAVVTPQQQHNWRSNTADHHRTVAPPTPDYAEILRNKKESYTALLDEDDKYVRRRGGNFSEFNQFVKHTSKRIFRTHKTALIITIIVFVLLLMMIFKRDSNDDDVWNDNPNIMIGKGKALLDKEGRED